MLVLLEAMASEGRTGEMDDEHGQGAGSDTKARDDKKSPSTPRATYRIPTQGHSSFGKCCSPAVRSFRPLTPLASYAVWILPGILPG